MITLKDINGNATTYTWDEFDKFVINEYRKEESADSKEKLSEKIAEFEKAFKIWKTKIDKVLKDNNAKQMDASHEFYDHLTFIVKEISKGQTISNIFVNADGMEKNDNYNIHYSLIDDIIDAMNDCGYYFYNDENNNNEKVMYIDSLIGFEGLEELNYKNLN